MGFNPESATNSVDPDELGGRVVDLPALTF